jgi:hypothetical protein
VQIATSVGVSGVYTVVTFSSLTIAVVCRYPDVFKHVQRDRMLSDVPSPRQITKLSDTPTAYSPDDMQLFHHYLVAAYPCIPYDFEQIWINDVPSSSHQVSNTLPVRASITDIISTHTS